MNDIENEMKNCVYYYRYYLRLQFIRFLKLDENLEDVCKLLNINLIFLPKYSPNLNPIEQVWRSCKNYINKYYYVNLNELREYFLKIFYEILNEGNFTKKWENIF